jgi:hypothetical protein
MRSFASILILSLVGNVLLAGWWLKPRPKASTSLEAPSSSSSAPGWRPKKSGGRAGRSETPFADSALSQGGRMDWTNLQNEDLREMIRRLRAVGCPEETIQDLVLAEVNRKYRARSRALRPERYAEHPYWETQKRDAETSKKDREAAKQEREIQKEKSAELVSLLGVDPEKERRKTDGTESLYDYYGRQVSFLPESKRDAVTAVLEDYNDKMQDFYARTRGFSDAESRAEQRQLEADRLAALAPLLSPQELREYELRNAGTASQLARDLQGMSLTREQYEAIFDIRKKYGDSIYAFAEVMETPGGRERVDANKKAMNAEIAAALGTEKANEYERSQDYAYQQLARMVRRLDLPPNTAAKVYDFKTVAEQSAKLVRGDTSLTPEQLQARLQQIRGETEATVKATLGEANYQKYVSQGGYWINNIAPTIRTTRTTADRPAVIVSP